MSKKWKQIIKSSALYLLLVLALVAFGACAQQPDTTPQPDADPQQQTDPEPEDTPAAEPVAMRIATLKGPTGVGMARMMYVTEQAQENGVSYAPALAEIGVDTAQNLPRSYSFELAAAPEEVTAMLTNGSVDIAALPSNLAANLYNKTNGSIQMLAINTYGMLYLLEAGNTIESWEDLRGKTVYATGKGANPEYILNYLLQANGLTPGEDVQVEFKSEHAELATLLGSGEASLGMLPEPNVTAAMLQNPDLRIAIDMTQAWNEVAEGQLVMTCVVARKEFLAEHPEAAAAFLADLQESIDFALTETPTAAQYCEDFGVIPKAAVAEQAIPKCSLTLISGPGMQETIQGYYQVLLEANAQAVGGALPDENFYYLAQ